MPMPSFTMRRLLEAGVHFGHNTRRWNPKMKPFIFGERNKIHIIDLQQTVPMLNTALKSLRDIAASGGNILFVGTKRQAQDKIRETAEKSGQYYVNHRWLGGMMTNWETITGSIKRLGEVEATLADPANGLTKKELLMMERERNKLMLSLGGIREMGGVPAAIVVIDTNKEELAIKEASKLNIPVFAVLDTNCNPDGITFPIPGNDDSLRAIDLYCDLFAESILDGLQAEMSKAGVDLGKSEAPVEPALKAGDAPAELDKDVSDAKAEPKKAKSETKKAAPAAKAKAKPAAKEKKAASA